MSVLCVVQARTGSTRLPGKVLMDLGGRPMLAFMLDRLTALDGIKVVVATSTGLGDDAVEACARSVGVPVVRGDEADVLGRVRRALDRHPADHVVRLTADCPLIDPELVGAVVRRHLESGADYTSNTLIRTHPDGLDVEVMTSSALRIADREATATTEREHVTPYLYRRPERFALAALVAPDRYGHLRWTVDTADDLERIRAMVASGAVGDDGWERTLGRLPIAERLPLTDGFEPSVAGEVPDRFDRFDDPADRFLTYRADGQHRGWARVTVHDGGASVECDVAAAHRDQAHDDLRRLVGETLQILENAS